MRTIRALISEVASLELYESLANQRVAEESRNSLKSALVFGASMMVAFLPYALGFYVGGLFVNDGSISMQQMMQSLLGLILTSVGAGQALAYLPDIKSAKTATHDIFILLDTVSKVNPFEKNFNTDSVLSGDGVVSFDNVSFAYPQRPDSLILKNLSFSVKPGLKVALVGPSGSGKSSIIALLQRFYDPQQGAVRIGGVDIKDMDVSALRSVMGFVGQEPMLFDTTMEGNLTYGDENAKHTDLERVRSLAKLDFVSADNVKWDTLLGPKGALLSGGQKQRTAIARAIIRDPKILLLDEATSALDSSSEKIVQTALDTAAVGRTTFVVAHRLSTIQDADLILVISCGGLVESGTHDELMALGGLYCQLYTQGTQ
jgi:ABC-type multidrug transport system fused ATPase/permease subunit